MFISLMHIKQNIHHKPNQTISFLVFVLPLSDLSLKVCSVNLLSQKSQQNRKEHHTHKFHGDQLIIRRGLAFQIELDLSRPFNPNTDKLHLELRTGQYNAGLFDLSVIFLCSDLYLRLDQFMHYSYRGMSRAKIC